MANPKYSRSQHKQDDKVVTKKCRYCGARVEIHKGRKFKICPRCGWSQRRMRPVDDDPRVGTLL